MIILIKSFCLAEGNPHRTAAFSGNGVYGGQTGFLSVMLGGEAPVLSFSCMSAGTALAFARMLRPELKETDYAMAN